MLRFAAQLLPVVEHPVNDPGIAPALIVGGDTVPAIKAHIARERVQARASIGVFVEGADRAAVIDISGVAAFVILLFGNEQHHVQHAIEGGDVHQVGKTVFAHVGDGGQGKALPRLILDLGITLVAGQGLQALGINLG
ncbi:hypothetical protein D3C76_1132450 [compost metagenome]